MAAASPAGPPPMTAASKSVDASVMERQMTRSTANSSPLIFAGFMTNWAAERRNGGCANRPHSDSRSHGQPTGFLETYTRDPRRGLLGAHLHCIRGGDRAAGDAGGRARALGGDVSVARRCTG